MKINANHINITKASGHKAPFNEGKLKQSLLRSGANSELADEIVSEVMEMLVEGISTRKIYKTALRLLRNTSRPMAARYNLKRAIMELGPSGFPFEQFVGVLLNQQGYRTQVGVIVKGHCVNHEVDVIAEKDNHHFMIECKFHNRQGYICDVKIPLYIQSRFLDVENTWKKIDGHAEKFHQGWVVTNTRFSEDAAQYGRCMNMNLVGWDYPRNNGLKDWIDSSGLHPVTCLTTLTHREKQELLDKKIVLCKTLHHNYSLLQSIGVNPPRLQKVMDECAALCETYRTLSQSLKLKK
jgi:hypothetical protein